ncbi:hypothetical protein AK812_SmicGene5877 [Symbiodinium microadriaticum]|uniref:Uncharacterized protein n=1 Tax=Symbiodinium microadriaticum TaxID=2951 RepID=A0A1Q9ESJ4_SYMMI|nr:hypothetical protein AK812_SmicGene5877 [Symbiodinium microadriaticum]
MNKRVPCLFDCLLVPFLTYSPRLHCQNMERKYSDELRSRLLACARAPGDPLAFQHRYAHSLRIELFVELLSMCIADVWPFLLYLQSCFGSNHAVIQWP